MRQMVKNVGFWQLFFVLAILFPARAHALELEKEASAWCAHT